MSKKVGVEALEVLYRDNNNVFKIYVHGEGRICLERNTTEANIHRIRKLQSVMHSQSVSYRHTLDSRVWSPMFCQLTRLSKVAPQPLKAQTHRWIEWLRTFLQYIGSRASQLSKSCVVEMDDDDRRQTSTLMRECLPSGYRKVQTLAGDFFFNYSQDLVR